MISELRPDRANMAWCIVGTAVYQVGFASSKLEKKERALKPDEHQIEAPTDNDAETAGGTGVNSILVELDAANTGTASIWNLELT